MVKFLGVKRYVTSGSLLILLSACGGSSTSSPALTPDLESKSILVEWLDNSDNEDGFIVERRSGDEVDFIVMKFLSRDNVEYIDSNVSLNMGYCYRVSAFNQAGSSLSEEVCINTP
ncbi:MAG: fibronectin type III domain-containing protein [Psychromonas sp.]|nr:fibronectin type III domain-containing protein [Alteromonadales bacterium]MCP5078210.1 fibronectin type III domain-containing protein [Psychromonas sp.]